MLLFLKGFFRGIGEAARNFVAHVAARKPVQPVADAEGLRQFLETRASHVTQTSLYGYLRTRAGTRYPELFANDGFAKAINAAKWNIWLACVSDLAIYSGGLICRARKADEEKTARLMCAVVEKILAAGTPPEADRAYADLAEGLRTRVRMCSWSRVAEGEAAFAESPGALVRWAPIMDELKQLDENIVRNSVRFRWQEVRQELRRVLDVEGVLGGNSAAGEETPQSQA